MYNFEWAAIHAKRSDRFGEERIAVTSYIGDRLHQIVYTMHGERKRIISLRVASPKERREYAEA